MNTTHRSNPGIRGALRALLALALAVLPGCRLPPTRRPMPPVKVSWDQPADWQVKTDGQSVLELQAVAGEGAAAIRADFVLRKEPHGHVQLIRKLANPPDVRTTPVAFRIKAKAIGDLELKFVDADGSVFMRKLPMAGSFGEWTPFVLYLNNFEYGWGGDGELGDLREFAIVFSGRGHGTVWLDEVGFSEPGTAATLSPAGPQLDPDRELPGFGFRQRRSAELIPEDPLVLEWLKQVQDTTTSAANLLATLEDQDIQTFNNALAAMAFMVKGERERAERILDFFANATDRDNTDPVLQNFFYNGEARGFFQDARPIEENGKLRIRARMPTDRWMGDMAWLLFAYLHHERTYGPGRYNEIKGLIRNLLVSWYTDSPDGNGGYVQHGWRKGDSYLHEDYGHPEGNIDCYAVFKLLGEQEYADRIRTWLDRSLLGDSAPLDLYTWRVLAYAPEGAELLNVPDYDFRYRKVVEVNGREVMGVYGRADDSVTNIWLDGVGHIACAYFAVGNPPRGNFYANQLDALLIDRDINGIHTRALPYVANEQGGFEGLDLTKGSLSPAAWYLFAKNRFNPMTGGMVD